MFASWKIKQFPTDYMWIVLLGTKITPDIHPAFLVQMFSEVKVQLLYFPERERKIFDHFMMEKDVMNAGIIFECKDCSMTFDKLDI